MIFYTNATKYGKNILYRGYKDGKQFFSKEEYQPVIYLPSKNEDAEYMSLDGVPLEKFYPGDMREADTFIETYREVVNFKYYGMENWLYNFIGERFGPNMKYDFNLCRVGYYDIETECENGFPNVKEANEKILMISISLKDKMYVFSIENHGIYKAHLPNVISKTYPTEERMLKAFITFFAAASYDIISGWYSDGFDLPYIVNRVKRVLNNDWVKKLSPWGIVREKIIPSKQGDIETYEIVGISHIDYKDAYQKFSMNKPENYKLDTIGWLEVKEKKLDYSVYGSLHTLYLENFQKFGEYNVQDVALLQKIENKTRIIELIFDLAISARVNLIDAFKQTRMWDSIFYNFLKEKKLIIPQKPHVAHKEPFEGGFVKETTPGMYEWIVSFDLNSLYPHLILQYNISPETHITAKKLKGFCVDYKTEEELKAARYLLSHMDEFECLDIPPPDGTRNIDPKILDAVKVLNFSLAANGTLYDKSFMGFVPELMDKLYKERSAFKKLMIETKIRLEEIKAVGSKEEIEKLENDISKYNVAQNNRKTSLNSAYGSLSQVGFRFFFKQLARAITLGGQLSIQWAEKNINKYLNEIMKMDHDWVTAVDTDSIHLSLDPIVKVYQKKNPNATKEDIVNFLDNFAEKKMQPVIDRLYNDLFEYMNAYSMKMFMKRETIADKGVYVAVKKYIYNVYDLEGVRFKTPEIKVTGVEIVRSSTPEFCRNKLKEAARIVLQENPERLREYMKEVKAEFMKLSAEDAAFPRGANNIEKYSDRNTLYKKGTPIQVRGVILYNHFLQKMNLTRQYEKIKEGDKIKFTYLKMPNHIFEDVIAFPVVLPKELGLNDYIDYDKQFEKTFYGPLMSITDAAKWDLVAKRTLDDLFE